MPHACDRESEEERDGPNGVQTVLCTNTAADKSPGERKENSLKEKPSSSDSTMVKWPPLIMRPIVCFEPVDLS